MLEIAACSWSDWIRKMLGNPYLRPMRMAYELCLATAGKQVPSGPDWIHEVKHDGYRMLVIRENDRVRLLWRNGTDWIKRYRWIAGAALKNRQRQFVIDGEAMVLGIDGISDFNALHSRKHDHEVQLYAFDILAIGGDDLRSLPLHMRKANLEQLLARRPDGITVAPFDWPRPVPGGLPDGPRGAGLEAP
jgi:bifunctional non-homologous end joining protein LigD